MIKRRQFFSILMIFFAVLLLFQGLQVGKERWNQFQRNTHTEETGLREKDTWVLSRTGESTGVVLEDGRGYILYVGDQSSPCAQTAVTWSRYTKQELRFASELPGSGGDLPRLVLLGPGQVAGNVAGMDALLDAGVDLVCMELPPVEEILQNADLRSLLGIVSVYRPQVELDGLHVFQDFLLGGERIYRVARPEDEKRMDLDLQVPWYVVRAGTKTYFQGMLNEEDQTLAEEAKLKNEDLPAIIWRNHHKSAKVYAVCGDYMSNLQLGIGLLDAIMAQQLSCAIYPVVNAQTLTFLNYPEAADENQAQSREVYGSGQLNVEKNVLLPMFTSLSTRYNFALTFCMAAQYDYTDGNEPQDDLVDYYLRHFNELSAELAYSTRRRGNTDLGEKLERDADYMSAQGGGYRFSALYADGNELEQVRDNLDRPLLEQIKTVLTDWEDGPILGYLDEDVTLQQVTSWAEHHTFSEDLALLGLETALGYSNTCFDMATVLWPETEDDQWQNRSRDVMSNLTTYNGAFRFFDQTTASQSDARVRRFLSLGFRSVREGDTLHLEIDRLQEEAFFLLRTHDEEVVSVAGGTWKALESGVYLITVTEPRVQIGLSSTIQLQDR